MSIKTGSYSNDKIYGLGNSLFNYILTNDLLIKDTVDMTIDIKKCICILEDQKRNKIPEKYYNINRQFRLMVTARDNKIHSKYGDLMKIIMYLENLNIMFENEDTTRLRIQKLEDTEIL